MVFVTNVRFGVSSVGFVMKKFEYWMFVLIFSYFFNWSKQISYCYTRLIFSALSSWKKTYIKSKEIFNMQHSNFFVNQIGHAMLKIQVLFAITIRYIYCAIFSFYIWLCKYGLPSIGPIVFRIIFLPIAKAIKIPENTFIRSQKR